MAGLDLHAVSSGGGTTLSGISTIAAGGDGATVPGVPIAPNPILAYWGGMTTLADTIREIQLLSQDQWDPQNGEYYVAGTGSLITGYVKATWIPYKTGQRTISMRQNTGAANNLGFTLDLSMNGNYPVPGRLVSKHIPNQIMLETTFGGALTAITWGNQAFAPTTAIPNGYYVILGAMVEGLTSGYMALLRFRHADFGLFRPGFPVLSQNDTAVANGNLPKDELLLYQNYQFAHLAQKLQAPIMPVFRATNAGTGLSFDMLAVLGDTPQVTVSIAKIADLNAVIS